MKEERFSKIYWIIGLFIVGLSGLYLNRLYADIYQTIGAAHLKEPVINQKYMLSQGNEASTTSSLVYVALGDSLSAGVGTDRYEDSWPYLVAQKLLVKNTKVTLKSEAVPGYQTSDVIKKLLDPTIQEQPNFITVLVGVNDIHNQVSARNFQVNYDQILSRLSKETKAKIYLVNLPYIGSDALIQAPYDTYFNFQTKKFNQIIKELAAKYRVNYIDLYTPSFDLFRKSGDHYSADLFHPSAKGYKIWADIIYDSINQ